MPAEQPLYMFYISLMRDQTLMKTSLEMNEEYGMTTFCKYFYSDCINSPGRCLNSKINAFYLNTLKPLRASLTFYIVTNYLI